MANLRKFLHDWPIISILIALWAVAIVTFATIKVFMLADDVNAALASCYGAILGLPAVAFGVFQWRMKNDNLTNAKLEETTIKEQVKQKIAETVLDVEDDEEDDDDDEDY